MIDQAPKYFRAKQERPEPSEVARTSELIQGKLFVDYGHDRQVIGVECLAPITIADLKWAIENEYMSNLSLPAEWFEGLL